jgi:2-phospho-L-lactate/phosphoenolpyruvate guanylyltransferase
LQRRRDRVIGISPIVGGRALKGPAARMMKSMGLKPNPAEVAKLYRDCVVARRSRRGDEYDHEGGARAKEFGSSSCARNGNPNMIFAVLPVKSPKNAKKRLIGHLDAERREELAWLLYQQTLANLCQAPGIDRVVVATNDTRVASHAHSCGVTLFEEDEQISHSVSADAACVRAKALGAKTVLLVPIDVPLARREDFSALAAAARSGLIVVPSTDGTGTNALVRTPPDVIQSCFGPGSFRAHMDQAREKGVQAQALRLPGLMFDIDTPEDVAELLARAPDAAISQFLRAACVSK